MSTSLVIGNGESRNNVELSHFIKDYTSFGCNAIHRDHVIDHLVCCDRRMVEESIISPNTKNTEIYVRPDWFKYFRKIRKDKRINQVPDLPYAGKQKQDQPLHWGSGPYAILLGAIHSETVMLLGFDLYPIHDKVNNVYKGTENYSAKNSNPVDYAYWVYQIAKIFKHFTKNEFIIWNEDSWTLPSQWKYPNVSFEKINNKVVDKLSNIV